MSKGGRPVGVKEKRGRRPKGEGSLRERSPGVWQFRVTVGDESYSRTVRGTREQASAAMAAFRTETAKVKPRKESRTFEDLAADWWDHHLGASSELKTRTIEGHESQLRLYILPALGDLRLDQLHAGHINDLYLSMSAKGLSTGSVKRCHAPLNQILEWGMQRDWLNVNPMAKVKKPVVKRKEAVAPETADIDAVIRAAQGQWKTMFRLAAMGGLRRGELAGVRWSDLDFERGTIWVRRQIVASRSGGRKEVATTKTSRSRRFHLDDLTLRELMDLKAARGSVTGYVFLPGGEGVEPFAPDSIRQQFVRSAHRAGVKVSRADGVWLHGLRHWNASQLMTSGQPVPRVQQRLGHASASTTMDFYGHLVPDPEAELAARVLGELIPGDVLALPSPPPDDDGDVVDAEVVE